MPSANVGELHTRLREARMMLLFTPELCGSNDPLACLDAALPWVDVVQVRPKPLDGLGARAAPAQAAETERWTRAVLERLAARRSTALVLVDDRVDVARLLLPDGVAGVHLGQDDCPVEVARELLGPQALVGWSTHSSEQVVEADELGVDYLGFGPVFPSATKGYERGLGAEAAWIASQTATRPVFPIGGITRENVQELARIGRAVVASAVLSAPDPGRAARELRELLELGDDGA